VTKILIVDDESSMRFLLRTTFELDGYDVDEAANGRAAAELLESNREYDLVSTDFMMPVMNGGELINRIRQNPGTEGIPIILISSSPGSERRTEADAFFRKPFDPRALLATAKELMEKP
jgi:CheY-like chemotaxis protein